MKVDTILRDTDFAVRQLLVALSNNLKAADNFAPDGKVGQALLSNGLNGPPRWSNLPEVVASASTDTIIMWDSVVKTGASLADLPVRSYTDLQDIPTTFNPIAHNLLSAYHGDTTTASVVRGDIIIGQEASPNTKWKRLAKGTSGYFFKASTDDVGWALHGLSYEDVGAAAASHTQNASTILAGTFSGAFSFDTVLNGITPTAPTHLTTKEYVDLAVASIELSEFFSATASDLGGIYYVMDDAEAGAGTITKAAGVGTANLLSFATLAAHPALDRLIAGMYDCHIHAYVDSASGRTTKIYYTVHKYPVGGPVSAALMTSETTVELTTDAASSYALHATLATEVALDVTDRLVIQVHAIQTVVGTNLNIKVGGAEDSHFSIRTTAQKLTAIFVPYASAQHDVDLGAHTLTATRFISTIAVGTAPLGVTSTTVVTNLNADLLDGQHGAYYAVSGAAPAAHDIGGALHTGTALPAACVGSSLTSVGVLAGLTVTAAPTFSAMTATRVLFAGTAGLLSDSASLTYVAGTGILTATGFAGALTGNVTGSVSGSSGSCTGNAATVTGLAVTAGQTLTVTTGGTIGSAAYTASTAYEPALGNPAATGYVLSSTNVRVRSWIAALSNPMNAVGDIIIGGAAGAPAKLAVGATGEYLSGATGAIPAWATLNQAAVAGLTTASTVLFAGLTLGTTPGTGTGALYCGALTATTFGCNGKAPQAAYAAGGLLAGVVAALIANGILSS